MAKELFLPKTFFDDHVERELPTPTILRSTSYRYIVSSDDPNLPELKNDAEYYASADGPDVGTAGLKKSAKALLRAINRG